MPGNFCFAGGSFYKEKKDWFITEKLAVCTLFDFFDKFICPWGYWLTLTLESWISLY